MDKKRIGIVTILIMFAAAMVGYYISHSLVILGASEGIVIGSLIGYCAAREQEKRL